MYLGLNVDVNNDLITIQRCAKITKSLHTYAHIPRSTRNPCQHFSGQIMQCKQGQTHNLPARWYDTLTANRVKNVCAHTAEHKQAPRRHSPNAVTVHATNPSSTRSPRPFPVTQPPTLTPAGPAESTRTGRARPFPLEKA